MNRSIKYLTIILVIIGIVSLTITAYHTFVKRDYTVINTDDTIESEE